MYKLRGPTGIGLKCMFIAQFFKASSFFLHTSDFLLPCTLPYAYKKITKNPLNYYLLKVKKFHGDSVKKESARAFSVVYL